MTGRFFIWYNIAMTFKRIDDATINCIITTEDLDERGLSVEDLFHKKEEATVFLKEIIEEAGREVNYHPSGAFVTMQIAMLPDRTISLTLSENQEASLAGALRSLAEKLQQFVDQLHAKQQGTGPQASNEPVREVFVYAFDSVRQAARFAATAPAITGESSLYKNEADGTVQLVMYYENADGVVLELNGRPVEDTNKKSFYRMIAHAGEYGRFVTADPRAVLVLCENNPCIIEAQALERLSVL